MSDPASIYVKAGEAYSWFERAETHDGEMFTRLKQDRPEWVYELVYAAHGEFLPDNWRYDTIKSALSFITENESDDPMDDAGEFADRNVDTYNAARLEWLSSNLNRAGYCDEALEEFGPTDQGIFGLIGMGQYMESQEIFQSVVESLTELVEDASTA